MLVELIGKFGVERRGRGTEGDEARQRLLRHLRVEDHAQRRWRRPCDLGPVPLHRVDELLDPEAVEHARLAPCRQRHEQTENAADVRKGRVRSEETTSEPPSLSRISLAAFCLNKKTSQKTKI